MRYRLDILLMQRQLAPSRERARALIMEGLVFVNGVREDKPGASFAEERIRTLEVRGNPVPYVSRGGMKLKKAFTLWPICVRDAVCLDIGASTGGFTDCMLQEGAARVYAVDSGSNQLSYALRTDARVVCMEQTNFRYVTKEQIPETADFAAADVSFISLKHILPPAFSLLKEGAEMVCLVKPQFEAGRDKVGKRGVVRDKKVQEEVLYRTEALALTAGFSPIDEDFSPIRGPEGNIEFLLYLKKEAARSASEALLPHEEVVRRAHAHFEKEDG